MRRHAPGLVAVGALQSSIPPAARLLRWRGCALHIHSKPRTSLPPTAPPRIPAVFRRTHLHNALTGPVTSLPKPCRSAVDGVRHGAKVEVLPGQRTPSRGVLRYSVRKSLDWRFMGWEIFPT